MSKLVIELQKACLNENISVADLLRKAYFIAQKLDITEMVDFCTKELQGYSNEDIPDYREIPVEYKAHIMNKWIPISISGPMSAILTRHLKISVGEMEQYLRHEGTEMFMSVPEEQQNQLCAWCGLKQNFEIKSFYQKSLFIRIIDTIKNRISNWAIDLEKKGILGDEFEFTKEEQEQAKHMTIININGSVSDSNVVGHMEHSSVTIGNSFDFEKVLSIVQQISQSIKTLQLTPEQENELKADISEIKEKINQKDESGVRKVLKKIDGFCQNLVGNLAATGVAALIAPFLV